MAIASSTVTEGLPALLVDTLQVAANEARGLAMDSIAAAHSGHMGLPLGSAEVGSILYGSQMTYNPTDPT
tara:strand:+ start:157 stop:366 length:210 start_codon:yes stop_codon:yes gene_type:complete